MPTWLSSSAIRGRSRIRSAPRRMSGPRRDPVPRDHRRAPAFPRAEDSRELGDATVRFQLVLEPAPLPKRCRARCGARCAHARARSLGPSAGGRGRRGARAARSGAAGEEAQGLPGREAGAVARVRVYCAAARKARTEEEPAWGPAASHRQLPAPPSVGRTGSPCPRAASKPARRSTWPRRSTPSATTTTPSESARRTTPLTSWAWAVSPSTSARKRSSLIRSTVNRA